MDPGHFLGQLFLRDPELCSFWSDNSLISRRCGILSPHVVLSSPLSEQTCCMTSLALRKHSNHPQATPYYLRKCWRTQLQIHKRYRRNILLFWIWLLAIYRILKWFFILYSFGFRVFAPVFLVLNLTFNGWSISQSHFSPNMELLCTNSTVRNERMLKGLSTTMVGKKT